MISRRTLFLALGATALAGGGAYLHQALREAPEPPSPPARDENGHLLWRNWSGSAHAYPAARAAPASEDELAALMRTAQGPIRVVGAGHSFMPLVPTDGTLVTLDRLAGLVHHDAATHQATVRAGTRLGDLGPALAAIGQEMPNLPDINKQALGGALATATHGTGLDVQALHGSVTAMRLVTARGDILDIDATRQPDLFAAARVGLGAFGVVTQVTLRNSALTRVHKRTTILPLEQVMAQWPRLYGAHRNAEFFALPFTGYAAVVTVDETDRPVQPRGPDRDTETLMDLKRLRDLFHLSTPVRKRVARALMADIPPEEAVDEGWKLLSNERPVRFHEMEFHLPIEVQMAALRDIVGTIETHRPDVFFPIEARIIKADDAWLSPFNGRTCGSLAVHAYYKDDYRFLFELIEPIFRRYGGRPHWGKLNTLTATDFAGLYPRWNDAMALRQALDPDGRLLNTYLKSVLQHGQP
ncbi:D-arabinono-1,4-lactone oxidase [Parapedomonas caeni]